MTDEITQHPRPAPRPGLSLAGLLACALGGAAVLALLGLRAESIVPRGVAEAARTDIDRWVELGVLLVGAIAASRLAVGAAIALACIARARRDGRHVLDTALGPWVPRLVHRLARGAVGVGVGAGLALTPVGALADEAPGADAPVVLDVGWRSTTDPAPPDPAASAHPVAPATTHTAELTSSPLDTDVPAGSADSAGRAEARPGPPDRDEVVVVRGDTLWDIASRGLPDAASDGDVLAEVVRWHAANRDVIGDDPDEILPGQVLRSP
ncbi:LysM peptidoglycan-binding domain-containing protein [Isoptericola sp. b515]|uniref:LysM peptidoglycan-binding domain-containing protein n=1 Tax=Isoptericola sp. b515 TaxID=3064652 RepID=UPI002712FFE5|nr:LysM peptidoglycan-binding domain-containing protein [Isoptericola sp. b515]MDO8148028.1 LysM peptidoglycan-binding domain-containing protein [Isoptericola sp. b515]